MTTIDEKIDKSDEIIAAVQAFEDATRDVQNFGKLLKAAQDRLAASQRALRSIVDRAQKRGWCIHVKGRVYFQSPDFGDAVESMAVVSHHAYDPSTNGEAH